MKKITVLDVGARGGAKMIFPHFLDNSIYNHYLNKNIFEIVGIEPDMKETEKLLSSGLYKAIYTNALSDIDGEHDLYITKSKDCSSLLKPNYEIIKKVIDSNLWHKFEVIDNFKVETKTLNTFCKEHNYKSFDLIKIDVQGVEYEIVEGGLEIVKNSLAVLAELSTIPWYVNQKPYSDFKKMMYKNGFKMVNKNVKPHILSESDYLFIKKSNQIKERDSLIKVLLILFIFKKTYLFLSYTFKGFIKGYLSYTDLKEIFITKRRKYFLIN